MATDQYSVIYSALQDAGSRLRALSSRYDNAADILGQASANLNDDVVGDAEYGQKFREAYTTLSKMVGSLRERSLAYSQLMDAIETKIREQDTSARVRVTNRGHS